MDKAKEIGIDWWEHDPSLSSRASHDGTGRSLAAENRRLRAEIDALRREGSLPGRAEEPLEGPRSVQVPPSAVESGGGREPVDRQEDREGRERRERGEGKERGARRQRPERPERDERPTTRERRETRERPNRSVRPERPERRGTRDDDR